MEFENDYLLLIAVGLPMATIVLMNVLLAATGEKGTLLLPSLKPLPKVEVDARETEPAAVDAPAATEPANESRVLEAA